MDFKERLSCIFGKQYLFLQDDGDYYNRYVGEYMDKEEAEEWLYEMFSDSEREIECLNNNLDGSRKGNEIVIARLSKLYDFVEGLGYSKKEINEIIKLDCEMR